MLRIQSVDCFRFLAIAAVIAIHTVPFGYGKSAGHELDLVLVVNQSARFAVPFFFVISGYFWAAKIKFSADIVALSLKSAHRVGIIFIFWSLIYLAIGAARSFVSGGRTELLNNAVATITNVADEPITWLLQGGKPHLWFLTALLISMLISGILLAKCRLRLLIAMAVFLYVIGLLGGEYRDSPIGLNFDFDFRNGPFFGLICFVSGYLLHQARPKRSWMGYGALLMLVALITHFGELLLLNAVFGTTMWQDYVGSTLFLGLGAAMMALSNHPALHLPGISRVGPFILGTYAVHYFFVDVFRSWHRFSAIPWLDEILYICLVLILSILSVLAMSRYTPMRKLVT